MVSAIGGVADGGSLKAEDLVLSSLLVRAGGGAASFLEPLHGRRSGSWLAVGPGSRRLGRQLLARGGGCSDAQGRKHHRPDSSREDSGLRIDGKTSTPPTNIDGKTYTSDQATIWRWRTAFQHDFAARPGLDDVEPPAAANHNPQVVVNGEARHPNRS